MNIGCKEIINVDGKKIFQVGEKVEHTKGDMCYLCEIKKIVDSNIINDGTSLEVKYEVDVLNSKHISSLHFV